MANVDKLVLSILQFLNDQKKSGHLSEEQAESLEVATQCLESVYEINPTDESTVSRLQVQKNLLDIFNTYSSTEPDTEFSTLSLHEPTAEEKVEAESLKNKGNDFMKSEKFSEALECYTNAVKLDGKNAVYYCNRAAAYSKLNKHQLAIEDCNRALMIDPSYSKAYGRLGIAYTALNDHESARECYRKALELDPDNQSYQNNLEISEQKLREQSMSTGFNMGAGGGFGDFSQLFNNPTVMNMAAEMMQNPAMQNMMQSMMTGMQGGQGAEGQEAGAPPNMANLMQMGQQFASQMNRDNPDLVAELRRQMQPDGASQPQPPSDSDKSGV